MVLGGQPSRFFCAHSSADFELTAGCVAIAFASSNPLGH
jgi:L,D-peptidoglycan transpeptidase YkuD (ErfK/YbiS/YcfS/YnhG family)